MSACPDKELLLHALVDGELDAGNALALEAHVASCAGCAAELAAIREVKAQLKAAPLAYAAPQSLLRSAGRRPDRGRGARAAARRRGLRAETWVLSGTSGPRSPPASRCWPSSPPAPAWNGQLVDAQARSLEATHLVDVETSDRHTVKPWFNGKIDFAPPVVDLAPQGYPLVGGRLDRIDGKRVAALVFHRRAHVINLFIWPGDAPPDPLIQQKNGYNLVRWGQGGLVFWAVSDLRSGGADRLPAGLRGGAPRRGADGAGETPGQQGGRRRRRPAIREGGAAAPRRRADRATAAARRGGPRRARAEAAAQSRGRPEGPPGAIPPAASTKGNTNGQWETDGGGTRPRPRRQGRAAAHRQAAGERGRRGGGGRGHAKAHRQPAATRTATAAGAADTEPTGHGAARGRAGPAEAAQTGPPPTATPARWTPTGGGGTSPEPQRRRHASETAATARAPGGGTITGSPRQAASRRGTAPAPRAGGHRVAAAAPGASRPAAGGPAGARRPPPDEKPRGRGAR